MPRRVDGCRTLGGHRKSLFGALIRPGKAARVDKVVRALSADDVPAYGWAHEHPQGFIEDLLHWRDVTDNGRSSSNESEVCASISGYTNIHLTSLRTRYRMPNASGRLSEVLYQKFDAIEGDQRQDNRRTTFEQGQRRGHHHRGLTCTRLSRGDLGREVS